MMDAWLARQDREHNLRTFQVQPKVKKLRAKRFIPELWQLALAEQIDNAAHAAGSSN